MGEAGLDSTWGCMRRERCSGRDDNLATGAAAKLQTHSNSRRAPVPRSGAEPSDISTTPAQAFVSLQLPGSRRLVSKQEE